MPIGEGLAGWVAVNRHTIVNSHADLDLGDAARELGLGVCTATPVFALGDLRGVVAVYLPTPRRFSESEARAVGALAQMMGMTMAQQQFAIETGPIAEQGGEGEGLRQGVVTKRSAREREGVRRRRARRCIISLIRRLTVGTDSPISVAARELCGVSSTTSVNIRSRCDRRAPRRASPRMRRTSVSDARTSGHDAG